MSGLPATGKDRWIRQHGSHWPVISLDAIRQKIKISPDDNQAPVVAEAKERAKEFLREFRRREKSSIRLFLECDWPCNLP